MQVRQRRKLASEINVVPYIDVMLVLLIIFMITAPLLTQGVEVQLPETSAESMAGNDEPVTLSIDAKGRYFLDVGTGTESRCRTTNWCGAFAPQFRARSPLARIR